MMNRHLPLRERRGPQRQPKRARRESSRRARGTLHRIHCPSCVARYMQKRTKLLAVSSTLGSTPSTIQVQPNTPPSSSQSIADTSSYRLSSSFTIETNFIPKISASESPPDHRRVVHGPPNRTL